MEETFDDIIDGEMEIQELTVPQRIRFVAYLYELDKTDVNKSLFMETLKSIL